MFSLLCCFNILMHSIPTSWRPVWIFFTDGENEAGGGLWLLTDWAEKPVFELSQPMWRAWSPNTHTLTACMERCCLEASTVPEPLDQALSTPAAYLGFVLSPFSCRVSRTSSPFRTNWTFLFSWSKDTNMYSTYGRRDRETHFLDPSSACPLEIKSERCDQSHLLTPRHTEHSQHLLSVFPETACFKLCWMAWTVRIMNHITMHMDMKKYGARRLGT